MSDRQLSVFTSADLGKLRLRCTHENCDLILDVNSDLTYSDLTRWEEEIQHVRRMLGMAHLLAAKCLRISLGGQLFSRQNLLRKHREVSPEKIFETISVSSESATVKRIFSKQAARFSQLLRKKMTSSVGNLEAKMSRAVASLKQIMPVAVSYKLPMVIENHWGISSRPENIMRVIEEINSP